MTVPDGTKRSNNCFWRAVSGGLLHAQLCFYFVDARALLAPHLPPKPIWSRSPGKSQRQRPSHPFNQIARDIPAIADTPHAGRAGSVDQLARFEERSLDYSITCRQGKFNSFDDAARCEP